MNQFYRLTILVFLLFPLSSFATINGKGEAVSNGFPMEANVLAPGDLTAAITGDALFCVGSANAMIVFEGSGGTAPYTFTYRVNGGVDQATPNSNLSGTVSVPVNTSVAGDFTYSITSIRGATGKTTTVDISRVITIRPAPVVDFSFTGTACSGTLVPFISSVPGSGTYSYYWDFGDGQTSTEQNPSHAFISTGCGTASFTVSLTVTDEYGCSATRSRSVNVIQKPDISFEDLNFPFGEPFSNCGSASTSSPSYTVSVGNTSLSAGCITSYTIDWGDGSAPVANASFPANHTYATLGAFDMVITASGTNGCSNAITYVVRNMNNPSVGITSPGTTTNLCAPTAPLTFEIAKWGTNASGTTYRVDYGDGSPVLTLTQEQLEASAYYNDANPSASLNYPIPHSYLLPNCPNGPYTVTLIATNACSSTKATVDNITVFNKTTPDFTVATHACVNSSVSITNTSIPGYNTSCNQTSIYTWDFGDGTSKEVTTPTLPKNTSHTYTAPGQYTIKLTTKNICGESTTTRVITIDPPLTTIVTGTGMVSGTINVCQDAPMPVITFTGTNGTAPYTFTYRINGGPVQMITTPAGSNSVTITVPTDVTGSFTYTLVNISDASPTACTQPQTGKVTVVVVAPPMGDISGNVSACINDASPQITFTGSGGTRPYTFSYTINGGPEQTISTGNSSNSVSVNVPTTTAGTITYQLIGMQDAGAAGCSGTVSATATARATIHPKPAAMILPDYEYCNGEVTSVINFSNTVANTTYRWTNSNPSIGLAASGNGNIPSFTARNTTAVPVQATITVTPSANGCDGASQTFLITVYPSAVLFSQGAQTICSGDQTAEVTLNSPQGAAISWTATVPAGITGAMTSGTNTIPVQTLVNTTSAPLTVTYTATATLPVTDPCAGTQYTYTITVNPRPVIMQAFIAEICSGNAFTVTPQANAENTIPSGTKYTWSAPVVSPSGAVTGASAQAIPQANISQTLTNTTSAIATVTYTVTPIANGCTGNPFTIVVTVLPLPTATLSGSTTVCQDDPQPSITFTGANGTAPYTFSYKINNGSVQTISTTPTSSSVTMQVPTTTSGSFIYTLVNVKEASQSACTQVQGGAVTVVVSAPPSGTISGNATVCLNDASPVITFTGSGGARPYIFTYHINGAAAQSISTSASSNSVTVAVPTTAAGIYQYNLTNVQDNGAAACNRNLNAMATVTIHQRPATMTLPDYAYCNGEVTSAITFTNTITGTTYRWTNSNPSMGLPASGTGDIPPFTALNGTVSDISSTITVTPSSNGCDGTAQSFVITVRPTPNVTFSESNQTICSGDQTAEVTLGSSTAGVQFSWTAAQPAGITGVITSGTNTIPVQTLVNSTSAPITVIYQAKAVTSGAVNCTGNEYTYSITVNPRPAIQESFNTEICSGSVFTVSPQNNSNNIIPSGTKYTWSAPVISPSGAVTGASAQSVPQASISQTLVNTTSAIATVTYTVTPIANGCTGSSFTVVVTVLPLPTATLSGSTTVCQDDSQPIVTFTASGGTAPYTFSYQINGGSVQTVTTTSGNSVTVAVPANIAGTFNYTLVSVQDKGTTGCMQAQAGSVTVVVSAPPSATISGSTSVCINSASPLITFTGSGGTRPYAFTYTVDGGTVQSIATSATSNSVTVAVPTTAAGIFTYQLTGVQDNGVAACSKALNASATVSVTELPAVMTLADQTYCNGENIPGITFTNTIAGTTYRWTNSTPLIGLPASGTGNISSFTALNGTSSDISSTITVTPSLNGCDGAAQSFVITVRPTPNVTFSEGNQTICSGDQTAEVILGSSTAGVQFNWTAVQPAGITGVIASGTNTIPVQTLVNTTSAPITVIYQAKATTSGTISCSGNETSYSITVNPRPSVRETFFVDNCSGSTYTLLPQANAENSIPSGTKYTWSAPVVSPSGAVTGASAQAIPQGNISQTLVNTTSAAATVTYTVTPNVNGCTGASFTIVVTVLPLPTATVSGSTTVCQDDPQPSVTFTAAGGTAPYSFSYQINGGSVQTITTTSGSSVTVAVPTNIAGTFTYTLLSIQDRGTTGCMQAQTGSAVITVRPLPSASVSGDATVCFNSASPQITFTGSGGTRPYTFTYTINGGISKSISTDASSNSVTVNVPTSTAGIFNYHLTGVQDGGTNNCPKSVDATATVAVTELPAVMTLADETYCNGESSPGIIFTNTVPVTTYRWTTSNPSIGLPASGTGNISSFTALNGTSSDITSTITVIPSSNGCDGAAQSFVITVRPTPNVSFSEGSQTICSGDQTAEVTLGSSTAGAQFSWTAVQPAGITGVIASGTNTIPVQTLVNNTSAPVTVIYKAKAATSGAVSCAGSEYTYSVTVNPRPAIQQVFQTEICSGGAFMVTPQANVHNVVPSGTQYTWSTPVVSSSGAVTGAAAQAIPQGSISQTLVNTTSAAATVTYAVTPIANGCSGISLTVVVTVLPEPNVNPVNGITLCQGEQSGTIVFSGPVAGTVYRWTSNDTSTGIAGSGTDQISPFTAVNTGSTPLQSTITVTPVLINGSTTCEGVPMQFVITVNPGAQVNAVQDVTACSGEPLSVDFTTPTTGGTTTYEWTNSNTAIGLAASGSGPLSFVPVNTGNSSISAFITATPLYVNNGVSCKGNAEVFTITVEPKAMVLKPQDQQVCNGMLTGNINFSGSMAGAVYQWTIDNPTIGLPAIGMGAIAPFKAINNGTSPVVASITVTPVINGCSGIPATFTLTVNPSPAIISQPAGSVVCLGEKPAALSIAVNGIGTPSYQWYSNTSASTSGGVLIPNANGANFDPPAGVAGTDYYYCQITFPNDCNGLTSAATAVTIHPNPVISAIDQEISSGEAFMVTPTWDGGNIVPPGTAYVWSDPVVSPAGAVSGATAQQVPQAVISQRLVNILPQVTTVTYTVYPVSGACTGASFKVTVYVDAPLTPHVTVTPATCNGVNNGSITTDIQGGAPFAQGVPYTVSWTGPNGFTSTDPNIYNLAPGLYRLTVTDSRGKQIFAETTVTSPEVLKVTGEKKDVSCYGLADGRISIAVEGGTQPYQTTWTKNAMPFAVTEDVTSLAPGTYEVTVRDVNGCTPAIMSWVIAQPDPLILTLKGKSDIRCFGDSAGFIAVEVMGGVPGYLYRWTNPAGFTSTDKDLSHLVAGDYHLLVTDGAGCTQSLDVTLTEPSPLAVSAQTTPISCYGANNATVRLNIIGGTPPYQAEWNNYATGTYQDNLSPGVYTILITDAAQCQISTTVDIPEAPVFRINPEVKNVSCYGARDGSIALNFETTLKSVILIWSDNVRSGTTRNNVGPGVYTVNIQGGSLCMLNRTFIITEPAPLVLTAAVTDITGCNVTNGGAIDLMVTGGTPPYRYAWSNGALIEDMTGLQAGIYAITVTDSEGCAQVAQYTVKRPAPMLVDVITAIEHDCASGDIKAVSTAKVSGGVAPYQLRWSTGTVSGPGNEQMETRQGGMVLLTVTDQSGCSVTHSFSIEIPNPGIISNVTDCNGHAFQFNGEPADEAAVNSYRWDFGDGTSSDLRNPQHTYQTPGTYQVRLTITAGACVSVYQQVVNAEMPPMVGIDKEPRFCPGDSVLVHATGGTTYRWNDGSTGDSLWISREGDYSVTGTTASGCEATYSFKASYFDLVGYTIQSDQQEVSQGANRIHFWSENTPYSAYHWDFGDGQSGQGVEVFHSYDISDDGYIDVTLKVINPNGCEEIATKRIWKSVTAIANTFTPNGDGINDIFLKGWQIQVFNRNGILMYQGDEGWDGKHDGRPVDNDTYFVIIYDSTRLGAEYKKSYVTVLR